MILLLCAASLFCSRVEYSTVLTPCPYACAWLVLGRRVKPVLDLWTD